MLVWADPVLLDRKTWESPPPMVQGDDLVEAIHAATGYALVNWETLEEGLAGLFGLFVQTRSEAALRVYGNIASAAARRDAIKVAAEVYFGEAPNDELEGHLKSLLASVGQASGRRNDIAHGVAKMFAEAGTPGGGYYLVAPKHHTRKNDIRIDLGADPATPLAFATTTYALTSVQIRLLGARFAGLAGATGNLARILARSRAAERE